MLKIYLNLERPSEILRENEKFKIEVNSIEEAREAFQKIRDFNNWGASDYQFFETGLIQVEDTTIARISYNGRVWDVFNKDGYDWSNHVNIEDKDFDEFLKKFL